MIRYRIIAGLFSLAAGLQATLGVWFYFDARATPLAWSLQFLGMTVSALAVYANHGLANRKHELANDLRGHQRRHHALIGVYNDAHYAGHLDAGHLDAGHRERHFAAVKRAREFELKR